MEALEFSIHRDIVEQCIAGDNQSQYELYNLYKKAMFNICYRMANDREEAEDMLQESFISIFKNIGNYKGTATIGAWIKRIVVNTSINYLKKKRLQLIPLEDAHHEREEEPITDWENVQLQVQSINQAVTQLPDGYRIVFSLYAMEGYDHKEIAEILGITESTSKSQYNRAKGKIKLLLKQEG